VPYDIFHLNGVTAASLNYLRDTGFPRMARAQQNVVGITINLDLGSSYGWTVPLAKNSVGVAFGFEHRNDKPTSPPISFPELSTVQARADRSSP
jgi:hypothetical protein